MGCLNSNQGFRHWFGNIHLSGPCNRSCYFCIGQHMMALDSENRRGVHDVFVTGTNTDPLLFKHAPKLSAELRWRVPCARVGIRTNAAALRSVEQLLPYEMGSVTVCSLKPDIYRAMMGSGEPPDLQRVISLCDEAGWREPPKVNVVLGPENKNDVLGTIARCEDAGIRRINLREPYGQPTVGNPLERLESWRVPDVLGMPSYQLGGVKVTYWDVHYCEVESVNLYASGRVSEDYPITRGHADSGEVNEQSKFTHGRHRDQWVRLPVIQ